MSYLAKVGSFNIDTSVTVGNTQSITDVGFQPKIVLFWWSGSTATGDEVAGGTYNIGFGAGISNTSMFAVGYVSLDASGTSDSRLTQTNASVIRVFLDATGLDGDYSFDSLDADGFTIKVIDQASAAFRISYLALGGTDLTNIFIGNHVMPVDAGNYSISGVGFRPDALIIGTTITAAIASTNTSASFSIGMAINNINQCVCAAYTQDNNSTSTTSGYGYNGEIISKGNVTVRESFVQFDDDGFTLNHLEGTFGYYYYYIALKGGQYSVGDITTKTDGTDIVETVGFQPSALLFASANRALSTQDTATDHARLSIGAATSTTNRAVQAISDEDNLADTETAHANYDSAVYASVKDDATIALMDLKSIESDGFTCVMDTAEPTTECWVTYLAIGATEGEEEGCVNTVTALAMDVVTIEVDVEVTAEC